MSRYRNFIVVLDGAFHALLSVVACRDRPGCSIYRSSKETATWPAVRHRFACLGPMS